jgi:outer membrane lipopolysaccharide assembly protein LptE/RlpB
MKIILSPLTKRLAFILLALCIGACAKPYHLNVKYDIPEKRIELPKNSIALKIIDARENSAIFSEKAQKEFDKWDGTFVLVGQEAVPGSAVETSDLPGLFAKALKNRLEKMNITVVDEEIAAVPTLELTLENFLIDLKGRTWVSDLSYEAKLSKDNSKTGRERIHAEAERTKVMGKAGGEKLIGEIFSEGINKLDLKKLFLNAGF